MIHHMLFWNCTSAVKDKNALLFQLREAFAGLKAACPGLLEARVDLTLPGSTHDVALYCVFFDQAALDAYQSAPLHLAFKEKMKDLLCGRVCADVEVEE